MRRVFKLTDEEILRFERLPPIQGAAFDFWDKVAETRGLDPKTFIYHGVTRYEFSGLPLGHGKYWCWPMPLACKHIPIPMEG